MSDYWPLIVTVLVAALPGIIALVGTRRKDVADVAGKYQEIAAKQAGENERLHQCQDQLEARVSELEKALVSKDNKITELERLTSTQEQRIQAMMIEADQNEDYIQALTAYVEHLVTIMQTAGLKPPAKPRRK